jgi:CCR4-NOT transcription complex subunit 7/8
MRCNVDLLKIIQVGLTLADDDGNYPQEVTTWQFNFRFSIKCVVLSPPRNLFSQFVDVVH